MDIAQFCAEAARWPNTRVSFSVLLRAWFNSTKQPQRAVARYFDVDDSSVSRWLRGTEPHAELCAIVVYRLLQTALDWVLLEGPMTDAEREVRRIFGRTRDLSPVEIEIRHAHRVAAGAVAARERKARMSADEYERLLARSRVANMPHDRAEARRARARARAAQLPPDKKEQRAAYLREYMKARTRTPEGRAYIKKYREQNREKLNAYRRDYYRRRLAVGADTAHRQPRADPAAED